MRKIIYGMMTSLDGYIEDQNHDLGWVIIDEELHRHVNELDATAGAFLYGRRTYETMAGYWPTAHEDPANPDFIIEYARIWQRIPKIVFSRTLERVEGDARLVREDIAGEAARLKAKPGGDLFVGGAELAASFLREGLIDEVHVYIHPVVLGRGTAMLQGLEHPLNLRLEETRKFASGVIYLRYQVIEEQEKPPQPHPDNPI